MQPVEMKNGAAISGALHLGFLVLALFGTDFFSGRDSAPMVVTEVELIDGTNFEAALSTAPVVPNEGPSELSPQAENDVEPVNLTAPDVTINVPDMPILPMIETPADDPPDLADLIIPPPPVIVPTEAPRPSIAIIPSPDELQRQAAEPESPPATEPLMALAAAPAPEPAPRPAVPEESDPITSEPTPAEAPRASLPPTPEPDELPRQAADPENPAATEPLQPLATVSPPESKPVEPQHEQEPEPEPEPETEVVTAPVPQPEAPVSNAPQEARLPVARPAKLAAAARASSATETVAAAPEPADEPKPAAPTGGSTAQFASAVTSGEKDALRLGIKKYFVYSGSRSDRTLKVTIEIRLGRDAKIIGKAKRLRASGGNEAMQNALFNAGRRALIKAQNAGEFKKLPPAKYDGWKLIHVTFTPEEIGFSS